VLYFNWAAMDGRMGGWLWLWRGLHDPPQQCHGYRRLIYIRGDLLVPDVLDTIAAGINCPAPIAVRPLFTRRAKMMQCSRMTTTLKMTNLLLAVACAAVLMGSATADEEEGSMTVDEVVELIEPFGDACTPKPSRGKCTVGLLTHPTIPFHNIPYPQRTSSRWC